jgi:hypothetical protein
MRQANPEAGIKNFLRFAEAQLQRLANGDLRSVEVRGRAFAALKRLRPRKRETLAQPDGWHGTFQKGWFAPGTNIWRFSFFIHSVTRDVPLFRDSRFCETKPSCGKGSNWLEGQQTTGVQERVAVGGPGKSGAKRTQIGAPGGTGWGRNGSKRVENGVSLVATGCRRPLWGTRWV